MKSVITSNNPILCILSVLFFLLIFLPLGVAQSGGSTGGSTWGGGQIIRTNWIQKGPDGDAMNMGQDINSNGCLALEEGNILTVTLMVRIAVPYVEPLPNMEFLYEYEMPSVNGGEPTIVTATSGNMMGSSFDTITIDGVNFYVVSHELNIDMSEYCGESGESFLFNISHTLMTRNYVNEQGVNIPFYNFPLGEYPNMFPPEHFDLPEGGFAQEVNEGKRICCHGTSTPLTPSQPYIVRSDQNELEGAALNNSKGDAKRNDVDTTPNLRNTVVYPSPFSEGFTINLALSQLTDDFYVECYNLQGNLMHQVKNNFKELDDEKIYIEGADWPAGIYFVRINNNGKLHLIKTVKQ